MIKPVTCELHSVVSGWESRTLKQPSSSDYSTRVYNKQALAQGTWKYSRRAPRGRVPMEHLFQQ